MHRFYVFILTLASFSLQAQIQLDDLKSNNRNIKAYSDSLLVFDELLSNGKISEVEYQLAVYRLSSEISMHAGTNVESTYSIFDSIVYSTMKDPQLPDQFDSETPANTAIGDSLDTPTEFSDKPMKIKMPLGVRIAGMFAKKQSRTKLGLSVCIGFNSMINSTSEFNYPEIKLFQNFYFQNLMLNFRTRLGKENSKIGIVYGLGLDYLSLKQNDNFKILSEENDKPEFNPIALPLEGYEEVKLRLKYIRIPLGLDYKINNKINIQAHAFYNILVRQRQYISFEADENESTVIEEKPFGLNPAALALHYHLGFKRYFVFFEHSMSSVLNNKADKDLRYFKVGIGFR